MDLERLREIIGWMAKTPVTELEISDGDFKMHLVRDIGEPVLAGTPSEPRPQNEAPKREVLATSFGVIHLSPAPASPRFVEVGQTVAAGETLCVIEAMKVFSPIEATHGGTISAVLVEDGAEVSAGQVLFTLE